MALEKLSEAVDGKIMDGEIHFKILYKYSIPVFYCWWYRHMSYSALEAGYHLWCVGFYVQFYCVLCVTVSLITDGWSA